MNNRELAKAEMLEKRVFFEQTKPFKTKKMKGAISLNNLFVGTVRPPDSGSV